MAVFVQKSVLYKYVVMAPIISTLYHITITQQPKQQVESFFRLLSFLFQFQSIFFPAIHLI